jgi:transcriptional regulator CtsR
MYNEHLNASIFNYGKVFCNKEFEDILAGIIACYYSIISEKTILPPNDENYIRDIMLYRYLKNMQFKNEHPPLCDYHFDREISEKNGRIDIRILPVKPYVNDSCYYTIECKRLDNENQEGTSGLNGEYVSEGVLRFVSKAYSFYKKSAGMIGFVIEKMDIDQNIKYINNLLKKIPKTNVQQELKKKVIVSGFDFSYYSSHYIENETKYIYHLMFTLSDNVKFITDCLEKYKATYQISGNDTLAIFRKHNVFDYISSYYTTLCTMDSSAIAENIASFIKNEENKESHDQS